MCGIAGILNDPSSASPERVAAMLHAMSHRGPDGQGSMKWEGGAAGMVRLALVDLSDRGQQPLWSEDGKVAILFNGEIYNYRDDRERLQGHGVRFHSTTDTEVILQLYLERGLEFVHRLRGMYALAIFDWRGSRQGGVPVLTLARGPLGIKPLYIAHPGGDRRSVVFSSEIRSMLASGLIEPTVDREGLADYLGYGFVMQPRTMIEGVRMMECGTIERYAPGEPPQIERFWRMPAYAPRVETLDQSAERLRSVLEESVRLHSLADAPVGAFLSGGIDSTGVVGLMHKHVPNLRAYTLRFPDVPSQDEALEARSAAELFGCRHTIVDVYNREVASLLPQFAGDIDQPSADGFNTWLVSRAAAKDVKAVLSGVGGDEWFAGYPVVRRMARYSSTRLGRLQMLLGSLAHMFAGGVPEGRFRRMVDNLAMRKSPLVTWIQPHTVFGYDRARQMIGLGANTQLEEARFTECLDQITDRWTDETAIGLGCLLDSRIYMINQLLRDADATSMAHSLELRVPLVDLELVNFTRGCSDDYKLNWASPSSGRYAQSGAKRVLIHALRDVLPPSIGDRVKRGFTLPTEMWMARDLVDLTEATCNPQTIAARGLVKPEAVAAIRRQARQGQPGVLYPQLWSLMMLELWCQSVLDGASKRVARPRPINAG